jgi:chemotaxis protein MotB
MSRRKRHEEHANHERWLVSYADFITLLFAFFVVMFASSQVDKRKAGKVALSVQVAFQEMGIFQASSTQAEINSEDAIPFKQVQLLENIDRTITLAQVSPRIRPDLSTPSNDPDLAEMRRRLALALAHQIEHGEVMLKMRPDGLVISLQEVGFFESGSAELRASSAAPMAHIAEILLKTGFQVRIEGHTDNVPIHNAKFASNWELSTARAIRVLETLIDQYRFPPERLGVAGYGEFHPVASNDSVDGRRLNRRVDIVVVAPERSSDPENLRRSLQHGAPQFGKSGVEDSNRASTSFVMPSVTVNAEMANQKGKGF